MTLRPIAVFLVALAGCSNRASAPDAGRGADAGDDAGPLVLFVDGGPRRDGGPLSDGGTSPSTDAGRLPDGGQRRCRDYLCDDDAGLVDNCGVCQGSLLRYCMPDAGSIQLDCAQIDAGFPMTCGPVDVSLGNDCIGRSRLCESCWRHADCVGYAGRRGGAYCQPLCIDPDAGRCSCLGPANPGCAFYCLQDCPDGGSAGCPPGTMCNGDRNCVPIAPGGCEQWRLTDGG